MKFKTIFILLLFLSAALVGAGFGFMEVNRIHQANNTIHFPDANFFHPVDLRFVERLGTSTSESFTAVGNIQFNNGVVTNCYDQNLDRFSCDDILDPVSEYLTTTTNLLGSMNGIFAGETATAGSSKDFGYAEYKYLNAPDEFAEMLMNNDFNFLAMSNSHVYDGGSYGVSTTKDLFLGSNTKPVGIFGNSADKTDGEEFTFGDSKGVVVSCTEVINDKIDEGHEYCLNYIKDEDSLKALCRKVKQFKMLSTDAVVVYYFFANQKDGLITDHQRAVSKQLFEAGADIIIGTNPDIVEPMEIYDGKTISGKDKKQLALYSLGSLVTGDTTKIAGITKNVGIIARFTFTNDGEEGYLAKAEFTPTYCSSYPTVSGGEDAGTHVNVFSMMDIATYVSDGGSLKSSIVSTKPAFKKRLIDDVVTTEAPKVAKDKNQVESQTNTDFVPEEREEDTEVEEPDVTEEVPSTQADPSLQGAIRRFFGVQPVAAKPKQEVLENEEYQNNLTKADFSYIDKSWELVMDRLFGEYKYEKKEDSVWFTLKFR